MKYLLADHLGSTTLSTDANGTVSAAALYKAFGEIRNTPSALGTDYKFTGQREEASLGLYFFVARWFDPSLGRFTSPDTIVPTSTQGTQAWDRYAFVNNNPVRYNDPTGHQAVGDGSQQRSPSSDPCKLHGYDSTECRLSLNLPLISGNAGAGLIRRTGSGSYVSFPPFNFNSRYVSKPITIYNNNPNPIAITMTTAPALQVNTGSPITYMSNGQVMYSAQNGAAASELTFDGTSRGTGFGIAVMDQANEQLTEATSISLAPETLNATFTASGTMNVPNTNLGLQVRVPVTVGITYNPASMAGAVAIGAIGGVYLAAPAAAAIVAFFSFGSGGILAGAH